MISVNTTSHKKEVEEAKSEAIAIAMEMIGLQMEGYAKEYLTTSGAVDTGRLRNSVGHAAEDRDAIVGTNVEYGPYIEFGTYKMVARPYTRPSVHEHLPEYKAIIQQCLQAQTM